MASPNKNRVTLTVCQQPSTLSGESSERVVIVVGAEPDCAEQLAQGFARQGEEMRVIWFAQACQALALAFGLRVGLAGVVVCHRQEHAPDEELGALRRAWPDAPVLAWQLN
jgi:propanediol dehydratase large subunit